VAAVEIFLVTAPPADGVVLAAGGPFAVQVGAFRQADRAAGLRREVAASFPDTVVRRENGWHKVQVGRLSSRRQAEELLHRLLALGYPAVVVRLGNG
jgi:cell division protein FtsN